MHADEESGDEDEEHVDDSTVNGRTPAQVMQA